MMRMTRSARRGVTVGLAITSVALLTACGTSAGTGTASGDEQKIKALEAGADDFLTKPINQSELLARVASLARIKRYQDTIKRQSDELAAWNQELEARVEDQVSQIERMSRLRRFLSPQLAELIVDITTTGATLEANGLKVLDDGVILRSQANLVASRAADWSAGLAALEAQIVARLNRDRAGTPPPGAA